MTNASFHASRALAYEDARNYQMAATEWRKASEFEPDNKGWKANAAECDAKSGIVSGYVIRTTDTHEILYFNMLGNVIFVGPSVSFEDKKLARICTFETIEVAEHMLAFAIDDLWGRNSKMAGRPLHVYPAALA